MQGRTVRHYRVWGRLSRGGMGDVWLARHAELALPVVIKTVHRLPGEHTETAWERLLAEARMSARLTSPRVVRVIDVGVHVPPVGEAQPFLVEEYVDGIDLAEFDGARRACLKRALPLWVVADYAAQAAEGLHAAHQSGVVHRDVKPSNLFGYGHGLLKVGDFGIAAASGSEDAPRAGTASFMAPEQFLGLAVDRRADVYSLGATAYALRYGRPPFPHVSAALRSGAAPTFPPARSPEEAYFQHVVARMLAREPDRRDPNLMAARHQFTAIARATSPREPQQKEGDGRFVVAGARVSFEVGDLTDCEVDALVNSATSRLTMRSGVGDAIRRRGGDAIEEEALQHGDRALGECVRTAAGALRARSVLHAVGAWNEVSCIARATHRALLTAEEHDHRSVAFPALGTGRGGIALEASVDAMAGAVRLHAMMGGSRLREVRFVFLDEPSRRRAVEVAESVLLGMDAPASHAEEDDLATHVAEFGSAETVRSDPSLHRTPTARISTE